MPRFAAMHRRAVLRGLAAGIGVVALEGYARAETGVDDKEIVLGTMGALTGPLASNGIAMRDGMAAMLNTVNDGGGIQGRKLRLVSEDNAYSAPLALAAVRRMVSNGGIFTLINGHATPQLGAVLPYMLEQQKVPVFGGYGGLIEWFEPPRPGLFGLFPFGEDEGRALGRWAGRDGARNILVLHIEGNVYQRSGQAVESGLHNIAKDGSVTLQGIRFGTSDYAPVAIKIAQTRPDAIVILLSEFETVLLAKEMKAQSLAIPAYAWVPVVTQSLIATGGANVEGLKATSMIASPTADTPAVAEYRAAMAKYFPGEKPEFFSLFAYGVTKVYVEALRRINGPITHDSLYQALYTLKGYDTGIFAPITFSPQQHQGTRALFQAMITGGAWNVGGLIDGAPA